MSGSGEVVQGEADPSPDLLDDTTRARLRDVVSRPDPVVDAHRWSRIAFLLLTFVVWLPTAWSGTKATELAVQQWGAGIALVVGLHLVLQTANRYARENATAVLRRDSIARSIAAAEALAAQVAAAEKAKAELKADLERRAEADRKAVAERAERGAAELAERMERADRAERARESGTEEAPPFSRLGAG